MRLEKQALSENVDELTNRAKRARATVLVVEELDETRFMIKLALELSGYRVLEAASGQLDHILPAGRTCHLDRGYDSTVTRQVLDELPLADAKAVIAAVKHGVVTLTGTMRPEADHEQDPMPLALRLIWDIDGVVDVVNRLGR